MSVIIVCIVILYMQCVCVCVCIIRTTCDMWYCVHVLMGLHVVCVCVCVCILLPNHPFSLVFQRTAFPGGRVLHALVSSLKPQKLLLQSML